MKKILIIDDDEDISELLNIILSGAGYEVINSNAPVPLDELTRLNPNLILLDHYILNVLGGEYCAEIKADPSTKHIPVLIVSAEPQLPEIAEEACADGYIEKPFGLVTLVQKIKRTIL